MGSSGPLLCAIPSMGSSGAIRTIGCSGRLLCPIQCMASLDHKDPAAILAIGTANPPTCIYQDDYPDFLFRVTNSEHLTDVKKRFRRICSRSGIKKRHFVLTEEIFKQNPGICTSGATSLNERQDLAIKVHPEMAMEAATKAINEWGQPKSAITHLIMSSSFGADMPGADVKLVQLLGLSPSINRLMLYSLGCHASGTILRIAKDIAENNPEARILAVSVETNVLPFQAPSEDDSVSLTTSAIFGDGAAAMLIGAVPLDTTVERPLFQIISASQMLVPGTDGVIAGEYREHGIVTTLAKEVPQLISSNLEACLAKTFSSATNSDIVDWNSIFWAVHIGYAQVLDQVEATLGLSKERLRASRHVREQYGNMISATVVFILDELRNKSMEEGMATTGEGLEWGVLLAFGPGITFEAVMLRSVPLQSAAKAHPFTG